jgi:hypothetical protein
MWEIIRLQIIGRSKLLGVFFISVETHQAFHVTFEFSVSAGSPQHLADEAHVVQGRGPGHVFGLLVQVRRHAQCELVAELA